MNKLNNKRMMPLPPPRNSLRDMVGGFVEFIRTGIIFLAYFSGGILGMAVAFLAIASIWRFVRLALQALGMEG